MSPIAIRTLSALAATMLLACGRAGTPEQPAPAAGCRIGAAAPGRDTVRIALTRPFQLDRIRLPRDEAERTLVRNVYETLVRTDCAGEPAAGLARRWQVDATGTRWTFVLRPGARFADGAPVTSRDVVAGWGAGGAPRRVDSRVARALVRSVEAADDSTFTVTLAGPAPVSTFVDPSLAILRRDDRSGWPVGTGSFAVVRTESAGRSGFSAVRLARVAGGGAGVPSVPTVLEFAVPPGGDLRNALDLAFDVVLTREPGTLAYARAIGDVTTAPLPWDRTYVLLAPRATGAAEPPPADALRDLAANAIRTEARPAEPPPEATRCAVPLSTGSGVRLGLVADTAPRILYPARDEAARGLAERIAALAGPPASAEWAALRLPLSRPAVAAGVDSVALERSLREPRDAAYILRVERGLCAFDELAVRAPWLSYAAGAATTLLVDTRARAILRAGIGAVYMDGDGALRFDPVAASTGR